MYADVAHRGKLRTRHCCCATRKWHEALSLAAVFIQPFPENARRCVMSRMIACVAALLALAAGDCGRAFAQQVQQPPAATQPPAAEVKEVLVGDFRIVGPIRCKNLTVFPVLSTTPKEEDHYIILEEGLDGHKVVVYEVGARPSSNANPQAAQPNGSQPSDVPQQEGGGMGDVNHLMVLNRAERALYLMPGEIILGGKQDRCVAKECVIPADGKPVKIDVYCVEHGRWSEGQTFGGKVGNLGKEGRAAVQQGKAQTEVWDSVQQANEASGVRPSTGAFTANYTDPKTVKRIRSYTKEIEQPVAAHRQVVGTIIAVNNKLEVVDVFGSTPLFRKVWPKLLKGYALDAAVATRQKPNKGAKPPTLKDAETFFRDAMESQVKDKSKGKDGLVVTKRESDRMVSFSASPEKPKDAPAAKSSFGGSVHSSGFSK
jgi:hypothetical protein